MSSSNRKLSSGLIGQRLIEAGYINNDMLQEALSAQAETGLLLGEVCLLKGWLTYAQLRECLPTTRSKIGEKLISLGYLNIEQLWIALFEQRQSGHKLGDILVERGWVDRQILDSVQ